MSSFFILRPYSCVTDSHKDYHTHSMTVEDQEADKRNKPSNKGETIYMYVGANNLTKYKVSNLSREIYLKLRHKFGISLLKPFVGF